MLSPAWRRWVIGGSLAVVLGAATAVAVTAKDHHGKSGSVVFVSDDDDDDVASSQGYLGVSVQEIRARLRKALEIPVDVEGLIVTNVHDDTPADDAGIRANDVILKVNGKAVGDEEEFTDEIRSFKPETRLAISIWRDGVTKEVSVTLGRRSDMDYFGWSGHAPQHFYWSHDGDDVTVVPRGPRPPRAPRAPMAPTPPTPPTPPAAPHGFYFHNFDNTPGFAFSSSGGRGRLGIEIQDLNDDIGSFFGVPDGEGVLVWKVREESPAAEAGLKAGDVIVEVEGIKVEDSGELREELADHDDGDTVTVRWIRAGKSMSAKVTLEAPDDQSLYFYSDRPAIRRAPGAGSIDRSMEQLDREMKALQRQMEELQRRMESLKD